MAIEEKYGEAVLSDVMLESKNRSWLKLSISNFKVLVDDELVEKPYKTLKLWQGWNEGDWPSVAELNELKDELRKDFLDKPIYFFFRQKEVKARDGGKFIDNTMIRLTEKMSLEPPETDSGVPVEDVNKGEEEFQKASKVESKVSDQEVHMSYVQDWRHAIEVTTAVEQMLKEEYGSDFKIKGSDEFWRIACTTFKLIASPAYYKKLPKT